MLRNPASSRLHASTITINRPGNLFKYLTPDGIAFGRSGNLFVTVGEVMRFEAERICDAEEWWADLSSRIENETELPGFFGIGPLAVGSFVFDPQSSKQKSVMIVPETIIGLREGQYWLTKIGYDRADPQLPKPASDPKPPVNLRFEQGHLSDTQWMDRVASAITKIESEDGPKKIVMARDIYANSDEPFDPRWPLRYLVNEYYDCWNFQVDGLVGSTPEMLVSRANGLTMSRVLAGTIGRAEGVPDIDRAAQLISSPKDLTEHQLAVKSVSESLAPNMTGIHVPEAPYVLSLPNLMHLATDICGVTKEGLSTLQLAQATHPTAAVCGTPTEAAREFIAENEGLDRGRYAGPLGWIDTQGDGEWCIALRCGQIDKQDPKRMQLFAGGGIMAQSRPHNELVETETKLTPMKRALRWRD